MLTLYVKTGCPFCAVVLAKLHDLNIPYDEKNISDDAVAEELIARGGKRQVPYLVDSDREVEMYESSDIAVYLEEHYREPKDEADKLDDETDEGFEDDEK